MSDVRRSFRPVRRDPNQQVYVLIGETVYGPYTVAQVEAMVQNGSLSPDVSVATPGSPGWSALPDEVRATAPPATGLELAAAARSASTRATARTAAASNMAEESTGSKPFIWGIAIILVVVVGMVGNRMQKLNAIRDGTYVPDESSSRRDASRSGYSGESATVMPLRVSAGELLRAYQENGVAADQRFKRKFLEVTGPVTTIDSNLIGSGSYVVLGDSSTFTGVQCFFDRSSNSTLARLRKGQVVTIRGVGNGTAINVLVSDCVVVAH